MNFYTISTFRDVVASLLKKPREGYASLVADICNENIPAAEYIRLQFEVINESKSKTLHQVDIVNGLAELSKIASLSGENPEPPDK